MADEDCLGGGVGGWGGEKIIIIRISRVGSLLFFNGFGLVEVFRSTLDTKFFHQVPVLAVANAAY